MYLKRIELNGFKTFPDLTEVILSEGITAVVGPNGCGKSNLMDAVRWVLGEQRPRVMRGGKMEEVIFGGTPQRQAMAAAEVTLIVDNQSGRLPTEYSEVAITRRLDRSGDSEYRLNGRICRLKDFHNLFMDTGMGSHGYAVIQSGMIDAIISENPEERRFLFEEAAGVSKYKQRQREALRKMDATEQDLLRLTDLKNEVATRVRSLARQKGMAERHKTLQDKWRVLEVALAARQYRQLITRRNELGSVLASLVDEAAGLTAQCETLELETQSLRLTVDEAERIAQEAGDRLAEANTRVQEVESQRLRWDDRRKHLAEDRERITTRVATLTSRSEDTATRIAAADRQMTEARTAREAIAARTREFDAAYAGAKEAAERAAESQRTVEATLAEADRAYLRAVSDREATARRSEELQQYQQEEQTRRARNRESLERARTETARLEGVVKETGTALDSARSELKAAAENLRETETKVARTEEELRQRHERLAEMRDGRALIASLIERGEGLGRAARELLSDTSSTWRAHVAAWVDRLRIPHELSGIVELVLADRVGALVCDDTEATTELIAHLTRKPLGRAVILDTETLDTTLLKRTTIDDPTFIGWLGDEITCDPPDRKWVDALLGSVALVANTTDAQNLFKSLKRTVTVASRDGVVFVPPGIIHAGTDSDEPVAGRLERLESLDQRITETEASLSETEAELTRLTAACENQQKVSEQARVTALTAEETLAAAKLALEAEVARRDEYERRESEWSTPVDAGAGQQIGGDSTVSEEELKLRRDTAAARVVESEQAFEEAQQALSRASEAVNRVRIETVEIQAALEAAESDRRRLTESQTEIENERQELNRRLEEIDREVDELRERLASIDKLRAEAATEREQREVARQEARVEYARRKDTLDGVEVRLREMRHRRDDAEKKRSAQELERSGIGAEADQWRKRVLDTHQVDLDNDAIEDPEMSDEDLGKKAEDARRAIDRLGPINPLALEEWEQERERLGFLESQIGDLQQAKKSLVETITELNETAGRRFTETFDAARNHFQDVFTELFRGGEADVHLVDPERPLDSPIEIYARPRGKKFIGIRQLSGGERALTALALLFALYLVKPSPFCILDEVDAPLDDANCNRFLRLLHRFKARTQFIIVTHNKLTMDAAEILYGVTMENPGVSKIVSVRLTHTEEGEHAQLEEVETAARLDIERPPVAETTVMPSEN